MKNIATPEKPIRASMLPYMFECPKQFMSRYENDGEIDDVAANTGSMVHAGIEGYHVAKRNDKKGLLALRASIAKYPSADIAEAETLYNKYVLRDKSNERGTVVYTEQQIKVEIPCAPHDPTQAPIVIVGTLDQIRKVGNEYWVIDHKSGRRYSDKMKRYYAPQLAAYMLGAVPLIAEHYGTYCPNTYGYITRLQDLKRADLPFWHKLDFGLEDCLNILLPVRNRIASIRAGVYEATPNDGCEWCLHVQYPNCVTGAPIAEKPAVAIRNTETRKIPLNTAELWSMSAKTKADNAPKLP